MKNKTLLLAGIILVKFILQYALINPAYDLQRDEYLHLDMANHLAWGYISVPPMTSWISCIIKLLGNGVFWVKFFPALFGSLTLWLVWQTINILKGGLFALMLSSISILLGVLLRVNTLYQPNSLDIFFWTLTYFTIVKYISTANTKWLLASGIAIGLGLLSKYNIAFLVLGLMPALLLTEHKALFINKHFYMAMGIALAIVLPNIIWQYQNHFPTWGQLQELAATQLVNVDRFVFVKDQFLYFANSIFLIIAAFLAFFRYQPFKKYKFFFWGYLFTIALFLFCKAKSYYAIGLYPMLIAFGAVYIEILLAEGWLKHLRGVAFVFVIGLSIPFLAIAMPIQSPAQIQQNNQRYKVLGLLRWEDGKDHPIPQDFADMTGWSELAHEVDAAYSQLPNKTGTLVLCDNYGQAGAINYYSSFKQIHAVSFDADYINWIPLDKPIRHVILIKYKNDKDKERITEKPLFNTVYKAWSNANPYSREYGTSIYVLKNARININKRIEKEIPEHGFSKQ
ncbi:glycosyltransferase family 39 protein [Parasediminibacterium sp. JCM 36343]|uniref:glycosyltransferase family 39 protein n=1 Tax=Parasediminibacterium sp. JCM 36343 TaxID=3374279 RepID=UPI0039791333